MNSRAVRIVHDTERLSLRHRAGDSAALVVRFDVLRGRPKQKARTGQLRPLPPMRNGRFCHEVIVSDRSSSYYTTPGIEREILDLLAKIAEGIGARCCYTTGGSMGGFGALFFAERLGAAAALAFSPRITSRRLGTDTRRPRRGRLKNLRSEGTRHLGGYLTGRCQVAAIYGAQSRADIIHMRRMAGSGLADVWKIDVNDGTDPHMVGAFLRRKGALDPLVQAFLAGDWNEVDQLLTPFGTKLSTTRRNME